MKANQSQKREWINRDDDIGTRGRIARSLRFRVLAVVATSLFAASAVAQNYEVLKTLSSTGSDGASPVGLIQGTDGNLYGTTSEGGANSLGTIFRIDANGTTFTTLHSFAGGDGANPQASLVQGTDGNLYGTTYSGGAAGAGTVFKINVTGTTFETLHSFSFGVGAGAVPQEASLIQGTDGDLYGTTSEGGANDLGTVFRIDTNGATFTPLHSFAGDDGSQPGHAGLVQGIDGKLYGTTYFGGASGHGTVFKLDTNGTFMKLHEFAGADGANPFAGLIQATDGNLYGTTYQGGDGFGTIFKIDTNGTFTPLRNFAGSDGANPSAALIQATDGKLYGTTYQGGDYGLGTIFKMDLSGNVTGNVTLHSFAGADSSDGSNPFAALIQAAHGNLYGTTATGGAGAGVVFWLSMCDSPTVAVGGTTNICNGSSATIQAALTGTAPWSLVWSDGFTQTGVASSPATRTVAPQTTTSYSVSTVSDAFCAGTSSGSATINVSPQSTPSAFITTPASVCANSAGNDASVPNAGSGATYAWAISNGTITQGAGTRKIKFTAGQGGPVGLTVIVTTANCSSTGSASVAVNPRPSVLVAAPASVCRNSGGYTASVPDAGPGATYAWSVMRGTLTSGGGTNAIAFSTGNRAVTIRVTVTNAAGCIASSETVVPLNPGC